MDDIRIDVGCDMVGTEHCWWATSDDFDGSFTAVAPTLARLKELVIEAVADIVGDRQVAYRLHGVVPSLTTAGGLTTVITSRAAPG